MSIWELSTNSEGFEVIGMILWAQKQESSDIGRTIRDDTSYMDQTTRVEIVDETRAEKPVVRALS